MIGEANIAIKNCERSVNLIIRAPYLFFIRKICLLCPALNIEISEVIRKREAVPSLLLPRVVTDCRGRDIHFPVTVMELPDFTYSGQVTEIITSYILPCSLTIVGLCYFTL